MIILKSITFAHDVREDRILAVVNTSHPPSWSCWMTRRLVLALLENADKFLAKTSTLAQRAAPEVRNDVAAFEREAAVVKTAAAMSSTPAEVLKTTAATAQLLHTVTLKQQGERIRMELGDQPHISAVAMLERAELQRILQMLRAEVVKSGWPAASAAPAPASQTEAAEAKPSRH